MNNWKLSRFVPGLLIAAAIGTILILRTEPSALNEEVLWSLEESAVPERIIGRQLSSKPFPFPLGKSLHGSTLIKVSADGMFIADWGDMQIKHFDFDGQLLSVIGDGRGSGPGEFGNIVDYSIHNGHVWIADSRQFKASLFSLDGNFIKQVVAEGNPLLRVTETVRGNLIFETMHSEGIFIKISEEDSIRVFGKILIDQTRNPLALQGTLESLPGGGFVYVPIFASYVFYFDETGDLYLAFYTPDGIKFPSGANREEGGNVIFTGPTSKILNNSISIDDGYLYVYTYYPNDENKRFLDRFAVQTGEYLNSYQVPDPIARAAVHDGVLYGVKDTLVVAYDL